jgi:hypothetical protein
MVIVFVSTVIRGDGRETARTAAAAHRRLTQKMRRRLAPAPPHMPALHATPSLFHPQITRKSLQAALGWSL